MPIGTDVNPPAPLVRREGVTMIDVSTPRQAERAALADFAVSEYPKVVAAVRLITGDREGAEDAVQDALAHLWEKGGQWPDNLAAWVTVAASNRSRSSGRRRGAESRALERLGTPPEEETDPTESLGDAQIIDRALRTLPDRQRRIAVLYYLGDHQVREIAVALGVSDGTVKTQLSRARSALAAAIGEGDEQ